MRPWKPSAWCMPPNDLRQPDHMLSSMLWHDDSTANSRSLLPSSISSLRLLQLFEPPPGTRMLPCQTPLESPPCQAMMAASAPSMCALSVALDTRLLSENQRFWMLPLTALPAWLYQLESAISSYQP